MQKKSPLSSRPPLKQFTNLEDPRLKDFIEAAESPKSSGTLSIEKGKSQKKESHSFELPWENKNVRSDVCKVFNLRLPETYYMKLKFLSEKERESHHKILMDIICPEIDNKIKKLTTSLV